jgi:hypothetical protein
MHAWSKSPFSFHIIIYIMLEVHKLW